MRVADLLLPDVREMLAADPAGLRELAEELEPADLAEVVGLLENDEAIRALTTLPLAGTAAVFDNLPPERAAELARHWGFAKAAAVVEVMSADERADLFGALEEDERGVLFSHLGRERAREVRALLAYPEQSAGGLMTTDFVALHADWSVEEAIAEVRRVAEKKETIYDAFAVDEHGILVGKVSLRDLVLAKPGTRVSALMDASAVSVEPTVAGNEVAQLIARYDLLSLPVVDRSRRLVGIVTVDDVVDLIQEQTTESVQRLGGVEPIEAPYFQTGFFTFVRKRVSWLVVLFLGELLTGEAMKFFESDWVAVPALMLFVPLIISSGGNAGSQSAALVIRALGAGEVGPRDVWRVMFREAGMGLALGFLLSLVGIVRALLLVDSGGIAISVGLGLVSVITLGTFAGALLPIFFKRLGFDPAVSSTPFIASLVDVGGLVIYFAIASSVLAL